VRRLFWLAAGATAGVLAVRKVQQTAESLSPAGLAGSARTGLSGLTDAVRDFADEVKVAMMERETDLREALGLDDDGVAQP
jgi:hypothetical protein